MDKNWKKVDNRVRVVIDNGVAQGHRTMFVVVGEKAQYQVVVLHHMLCKSVVKARPSILWCYKKELGFNSHRKKRMKSIQNKVKAGKFNVNEDDPFEQFVVSTNIRYCYYNETRKILGNTYGACVLQDFEALTPNLLAQTIETVEGGGLVILLLKSLSSLKQLYTLNMDVHQRYRTEAHQDVVCRFNERFLLSLASCKRCLVVDDQLRVLPICSDNLRIEQILPSSSQTDAQQKNELELLKESFQDTRPVSALINCCKTVDQAKALLKFIEIISEKTLRSTVSLTAARGRGKSATLGLAIAGAVAFGYSNIYISSPAPENLKTLFEFVFKGFDALSYEEHVDYSIVQSTNPEYNKATVRVNVTLQHRQTIQYIHPTDAHKLSQAELLIIDEAAAIPLPHVKALLGPYLVFLSSTINGYEGTGRSLSLKLLQQLRMQATKVNTHGSNSNTMVGRQLHELVLDESIRYKPGDYVESWLTNLLCLDVQQQTHAPMLSASGCPPPDTCQLYYINRDTLFSYHRASEQFLQRLVALNVASHYKNSPNDLQMMSDAPAHHLFCLLGPVDPNRKALPEILVVIQVCLEGEISKTSIVDGLVRGKRSAGDLIPWTIAQQYQDNNFPSLAGARIVRIATHPDYHSMGYGHRALNLLVQYYEMKIPNIDDETTTKQPAAASSSSSEGQITQVNEKEMEEGRCLLEEETIEPRAQLPPLLSKLSERTPERLDYIGVSFGLTARLLKFWKKSGFVPVYLRQTTNDITGEHSCIMLSKINSDLEKQPTTDDSPSSSSSSSSWLDAFWQDFRRRFISLLSFAFATYDSSLALCILTNKAYGNDCRRGRTISQAELYHYYTLYDVKRLEMYSSNMVDYHLIMDLLPALARMYFLRQMADTHFSPVQEAILLGIGLQHKTVDVLAQELDLPSSQLLGLFNRIIRKAVQYLNTIAEKAVELNTTTSSSGVNDNIRCQQQGANLLEAELVAEEKKLKHKQKLELQKLQQENLSQYAIKGTAEEWDNALKSTKLHVSVKRLANNNESDQTPSTLTDSENQRKRQRKKKRY